jgi:hypothetical protein
VSKPALSELAGRILAEHDACIASARDAVTRAIEVGRLLTEAKEQVRWGQWGAWVCDHCSFSVVQARTYMIAFRNRDALGVRPKESAR